jgi:glutamine synthetase
LGPIDLGENARRDMVLALEEMGYGVEASHHEVAPGQHEIDARYEEGLAAADYIMTFKLAIKSIAKRHGLFASFMPKPRAGENGSGMHINMSLSKNGKNIFTDENDALGLSKEAYWFIGGLMKHAKAMTAITNPLVNSYKRLIPGFEAPVHVAWSAKSRNQMIRIPSGRGESTRIELRSPDPSMNPYLALAVCLAAGLDGIENHIMPPRSVEEEAEVMQNDRLLPRDLKEALTELEKDDYMKDVLGVHVSEKFIEAKRADWEAYCSAVTSWEIEEYLYKI